MDLFGPVLGIESSCDETAAAVLAPDGRILAEAVLSQTEDHARFGGVVPELAARAHLLHLPSLAARVMEEAGVAPQDLGGVAATSGPGLIGGLIVGAGFGKGIAMANHLPFVAVNHLEAHALTPRLPGLLPGGAAFPYLLLLLSGGHCQCVAVEGLGRYRRLGTTLDDAVGEAFDKAAKLLGLPWPGGPHLERLAAQGDPTRIPLPRPLLGRPGCDFSFSGLKTAVAQAVGKATAERDRADIAAAFQTSVATVVADRARNALAMAPGATALVVSGGVAANGAVRTALAAMAQAAGLPLVAPPIRLCTDNAVMVAWAGIERLRAGLTDPWDHAPRPRWPLDELAPRAAEPDPA
jgi:N6-L-threonylcarbamoyladenine synthase